MRRLVVAVLLALAASLVLAIPAGAQTFIQALGHKDTYFNHFGDPAKGRVHAYAEGQEFDTGLRGYRMSQVDSALRRAAYDVGYKTELVAVLEAEGTAGSLMSMTMVLPFTSTPL